MIALLPEIHFKIWLLPLFLFFAGYQQAYAQSSFTAVSDETKIGYEDVLHVKFKIENAGHIESFTPPTFKNFTIVGGPNQERGMRSINGKVDEYVSISFDLKPNGPGKYEIGSAKATIDGKNVKTAPLKIEVTKDPTLTAGSSPNTNSPFSGFGLSLPPTPQSRTFHELILKPGENVEEKIKENLFVRLDVNKTSCFVGEPVTAAFKLYTRLRSETTITNAPSFNGFSVSDLTVNEDVKVENVDGKPFNVYTLRKVQMYPMHSGNITLDPIVSDNNVTFLKSGHAKKRPRDLFSQLFGDMDEDPFAEDAVANEQITLKSEPVVIHVKELPQENVPNDFKGAVGQFTINAKLDKQEFTTDGSANLIVTITGKGNLQLLNAPEISWPANVEGYDPKVEEQIEKSSVPLSGRKVFTFPFTVSKAGEYSLDSIHFSYFDPQTSSYSTINTEPLSLNVFPGRNKISLPFTGEEKSQESVMQRYSYEIILGIIGLIVVLLLIVLRKSRYNKKKQDIKTEVKVDNINATRPSEEFKIPENVLLPLHEILKAGDAAAFYRKLNEILKKYLSEKFDIPTEDISRKTINEELDKHAVGLNTSLLLNSLLEEIELNLYSVAGEQELQRSFEKASQIISVLNKQCPRV